MTSDHYATLRVHPGAEHAVIRAAYRALMRLYHPDASSHPEAQERVRELTAAYGVLRDPAKRAAYDAQREINTKPWTAGDLAFPPGERPPPAMRNVGLACVAVAFTAVIATVSWPNLVQPPSRHRPQPVAATSPVVPAAEVALRPSSAPVLPSTPPVVDPAPEVLADAEPAPVLDIPAKQPAVAVPRRERVTTTVRAAAPPVLRKPSLAPRPAAVASSDAVSDGTAAKLDLLAAGFLKQSMAHADSYKQQLLLSARNRSATTRHLCRSNDCVIKAYGRQMREISAIMENRPLPDQ